MTSRDWITRLARMEAQETAFHVRQLERMSDEDLEAFVLDGRPESAEEFRTRGDPLTWPEYSAESPDIRGVMRDMYAEWQSGAWGIV
jgi:hypothetical protein